MTSDHLSDPPLSPEAGALPSEAQRRAFTRAKWIILILVALVAVGLDQWSKHWAQTELQHRPHRRITVVEGYFNFSYVRNPGAAWGFLAKADESFRKPFFIGISVAAMVFILYLFIKLEVGQYLMLYALALVMGGALGNFIDRLRYNYVVDFIDVHLEQRFRWPTFNVADIAISIGVVLLFAEMLLMPILYRRRQRAFGLAGAPDAAASDNSPAASSDEETGER